MRGPCASSIAVFSSRESPDVLLRSVEAAWLAAVPGSVLDVIVNGNRELAEECSQVFPSALKAMPAGVDLRLWFIACADKAHAWNTYLHQIWPGSELAFFVDGYARLRPNSCSILAQALQMRPEIPAASGTPSSGWGAAKMRAQMLSEGGIHGNFYALRARALNTLRDRGFRLPLGLYRTDPALAAVLKFRLDPARYEWDDHQVYIDPDASWDVDSRPWWRLSVLRGQYQRRLRQYQGVFENRALRDHLARQKRAPEEVPETVSELIRGWGKDNPDELYRVTRSFLARRAWERGVEARDWSDKDIPPALILECGGAGKLPFSGS
ncbi:hypothetical protein [Niveibacterium terrae]|uniref:hypothetical protein n=1 Tax=Niveibacterium terrae TaxID=3373598 RepID=UPI003A93B515